MFYKIDLSFLTYETLSAESITIIESHKWDIEQYQQSDGSICSTISFENKKIFSYGSHFYDEYEPWYVEQLEQYGNLLKEIGFNDITIFLNVFAIEDDGEFPQCNFEIFNSTLLTKILSYGISLPISIYSVSIEQAMEYLEMTKSEIELEFFN